MCAFKHFKIGFFMLLFVVGKTNPLQGLSLCQVFCFNVLKFLLTINISFFFVRFRNLKGTEYHGS